MKIVLSLPHVSYSQSTLTVKTLLVSIKHSPRPGITYGSFKMIVILNAQAQDSFQTITYVWSWGTKP